MQLVERRARRGRCRRGIDWFIIFNVVLVLVVRPGRLLFTSSRQILSTSLWPVVSQTLHCLLYPFLRRRVDNLLITFTRANVVYPFVPLFDRRIHLTILDR